MISSVNILILNQRCPINNIIPLPESPLGAHGDPSGPMNYKAGLNSTDTNQCTFPK